MNESFNRLAQRKNNPRISIDIALTTRCLLSCRYCTVAKKSTPELKAEHWREIIRSLAALRTIDLISLEGGEPFCREDLAPIIETSLQYAHKVKVVTSGSLPCRLPQSLVANPRFSMEVSLDGPVPLHNFLRDGSHSSAWNFLRGCLQRGNRAHFRSVISRHNLLFYEAWLKETDRAFDRLGEKVGFFFDTIIAPLSLSQEGGSMPRAAVRNYPAKGLIPTPIEIWDLFWRVRKQRFASLVFLQDEPIRGCRAARSPFISFDPSGVYSFCCESPKGWGTILEDSPQVILARMDEAGKNLPCRLCPYLRDRLCSGCWTGQKCGLVGHWGFSDCRALVSGMIHQAHKVGETQPAAGGWATS